MLYMIANKIRVKNLMKVVVRFAIKKRDKIYRILISKSCLTGKKTNAAQTLHFLFDKYQH